MIRFKTTQARRGPSASVCLFPSAWLTQFLSRSFPGPFSVRFPFLSRSLSIPFPFLSLLPFHALPIAFPISVPALARRTRYVPRLHKLVTELSIERPVPVDARAASMALLVSDKMAPRPAQAPAPPLMDRPRGGAILTILWERMQALSGCVAQAIPVCAS